MKSEWCVSISNDLVVAWIIEGVLRLEKPGVPFSPSSLLLETNIDRSEASDAESSSRLDEMRLAWAGIRTLVCGDGTGLVRVFSVGEVSWSQLYSWSLRDADSTSGRKSLFRGRATPALSPKSKHIELFALWSENTTVWYRYGRRCVRIQSDRSLGARRLLPSDNVTCTASVDATSFIAGVAGKVLVYSWSTEETDPSSMLSLSALGSAVWGAFFARGSSTKEEYTETYENEQINYLVRSPDDLAQFSAPVAELAVLNDTDRNFERICTSPQGRYAALSDDRGRVFLLVCRPAPAIVAAIFKGYRKTQCDFIPNARGLAILSLESKVIHVYLLPWRTLAAVYALETPDPHLSVAQGNIYLCTAADDRCRLLRLETKLETSSVATCTTKRNYAALRSFRSARRSGDVAATLTALGRCYSREGNDDSLLARAIDDACNELSCGDVLLRTILDAAIERCSSIPLRTHLERMRELALAAAKAGLIYSNEGFFSAASNAADEECPSFLIEASDWLKIPERIDTEEEEEALLISQVSIALKQHVNESIPLEEEYSLASLFRGAVVWQALVEENTWSAAQRASCLGVLDNTQENASVLISAARIAARILMRPIASGDIFGLRGVDELAILLKLGPRARGRLCAHWLTTEISLATARQALVGPVLSRFLKDAVLPKGIEELVFLRWDTRRPARMLGLCLVARAVINELVETEEKRTYGSVDKSQFSKSIDLIESSIHQLRVAAVLSLGPPRCSEATVRALDKEQILLADVLQEDAACAQEDQAVQSVDNLARIVADRTERGWVHRRFPELEPDALRICYALRLAAPQAAALLRTTFFQLRSINNDEIQNARLVLVIAAVCEAWRQAAAGPLLAALDHIDGDNAEHQSIIRAVSQLVDVLLEAFKLNILSPPSESTAITRVDDLLLNGGSAFASGDAWPSRRLSLSLSTAWQNFRKFPPAPERIKQLAALCRCLQLVLATPTADLPLACVSDLFGLAEQQRTSSHNQEHHLLQLHTAPRDDLSAFADMAEATLTSALTSPQMADKLRATALTRRGLSPHHQNHYSKNDDSTTAKVSDEEDMLISI
uniref:Rab3-GAP regulatory subunit N-terminal domain-containing protein n=1 Tax=Aureoumbra lagunensis TaxID=44058 RepID=A0A7S3JTI1_9STRA|mmetsp:Transcript_16966/g.25529  ORF Transcript_16966/g.25529 Transcript_16966/m.25529 type:complete len:1076 (-) Transcript_16966:54-3281(-)|eukprot:CAMPEP_0197324724 /NCGR_PEP_ID=MMETSP0891-20130614/71268_1 /TAXON_ID=44058 ORGANISM="Aureoumbra lagunensis, Strain CCMP1510" /NCGR_SAMPLE_ID=MMETSP0891 /ASSEMBLY_ACC=CAM_ASM_000534 /LENGTH=1075 /DNA_ID=CAMNT_0042817577 /DNA_START=14 /DNA_END=3241 /DNA_ORIENTATION=-